MDLTVLGHSVFIAHFKDVSNSKELAAGVIEGKISAAFVRASVVWCLGSAKADGCRFWGPCSY
jgi:hypothetical protein